MGKSVRASASSAKGIGAARFALIRAAATHIRDAVAAGYRLEAIALTESILTERMEKRVQMIHSKTEAPSKALENLKDGFAVLGDLVQVLRKYETDLQLRAIVERVDEWRKARNRAVHEMAKLDESPYTPFADRVEGLEEVADAGIELLLAYDLEERRLSHECSGKRFPSATCPDALAPLGQRICTFCAELAEA